ncbi:MAG TPA: sigma-70 family RNA polymerase sigma factor [Herpetosiphonaceae bacterium]
MARIWPARAVPASTAIDWEAVYRDYFPRVYNFFRYRISNATVCEDLTAATFEKIWRNRIRYRSEQGAVSTWIFTIARRVAIDHWREAQALPLAVAGDIASPEDVAHSVHQRLDHGRLAGLLAALPARERDLVALKYGARLTNRAIAELTGLSESNVGTIVARTVAALRSQWEEPDGAA